MLLTAGVVVVDLPAGVRRGLRPVQIGVVLHVLGEVLVGEVGIGLRAHNAAHGLVAVAVVGPLVDQRADDAPAVGLTVLGVLRQVHVHPVLGDVAHLNHAVDGHVHVVLAEGGGQHLHDLGADLIGLLLLQLHFQGGGVAVGGQAAAAVCIAVGVGEADPADLQPLEGVAHQLPDGRGLLGGELFGVLHGHPDGGGGVDHVAAVQNVAAVLARRQIDGGVLHVLKAADGGPQVLLKILQHGQVPLLVGGEGAEALIVLSLAGLEHVLHQHPGLQLVLLALRHQDRVPVLHLIVPDAPGFQQLQHAGHLIHAHAGDQRSVGLVI